MHLAPIVAVTLALLTSAGSAAAQSTPPATTLDTKPGTLSDKLGDSKGVIKPTTNVDPAMHVPAPATGSTPVIKPGDVGKGTAK